MCSVIDSIPAGERVHCVPMDELDFHPPPQLLEGVGIKKSGANRK